MIEDMHVRNFSTYTIENYIRCVASFAKYFMKSPDLLDAEHVREYQVYLVHVKKASWSLFNQTVCALRFLYNVTLDRPEFIRHIPYAKPEKRLPVILSPEEVGKLLRCVTNLKLRTILMTIYAAGLRISEALGLKVQDIDSERMLIRVEQGKGKKDRYVPLSPTLLGHLRNYWRAYQPQTCLFPGRHKDKPITKPCVQRAIRTARRLAGIEKPVTCHTLRHCYATHHLEAGTDLRRIQLRLGHRSLNTTAQYLHVTAGEGSSKRKPNDLLRLIDDSDKER
jgi:site-specific recombinase XerD